MADLGQILSESGCLPPAREAHRLQGHLLVAILRSDHGSQAEELLREDAQPVSDIQIGVRHAKPDPLGVQAAVAHEVADKLG